MIYIPWFFKLAPLPLPDPELLELEPELVEADDPEEAEPLPEDEGEADSLPELDWHKICVDISSVSKILAKC